MEQGDITYEDLKDGPSGIDQIGENTGIINYDTKRNETKYTAIHFSNN